jgi:hypothetical protein
VGKVHMAAVLDADVLLGYLKAELGLPAVEEP